MPLELGQTLITRICIRLKTLLTVHTVHLKNDGSKSESINCHHYRKGERQATLPSCLLPLLLFEFRQFQSNSTTHLSTAVAWREKKYKHFVFNKYFCLVLGLLKSRILEKTIEPLLNKPDFKLFHYKARVQPVSKITTVATRNRCWL